MLSAFFGRAMHIADTDLQEFYRVLQLCQLFTACVSVKSAQSVQF